MSSWWFWPWLFLAGFLVMLVVVIMVDYFPSRERKLKPRRLISPEDPVVLKDVQRAQRSSWEEEAEVLKMDQHYRETSDPHWRGWGESDCEARRDFYQHAETNKMYVVEVSYDGSLVGSCGPMDESVLREYPFPQQYDLSSEQNSWIEANNEKLFQVLFERP